MVYLQNSIKKGNGFFQVERPSVVEAIINHFVSKAREEPKAAERKTKTRQTPQAGVAEKSPYEILQISPGATREEMTVAYRQMAKLYHPDKVASLAPEFRELAELRMKEINAAYQVLTR